MYNGFFSWPIDHPSLVRIGGKRLGEDWLAFQPNAPELSHTFEIVVSLTHCPACAGTGKSPAFRISSGAIE